MSQKHQAGSQVFKRGEEGGRVTLCQSEGAHQLVMSFSPPVVQKRVSEAP